MRPSVIFNFIKEECSDLRRLLIWYFLSSLFLDVMVIVCSHQEDLVNWIREAGISFEKISMISFAILFVPYAVSWMMLSNRTDKDSETGFYSFVHILPITPKEIVTGKYMSHFLLIGLMASWLCGLWWFYEVNVPYSADLEGWTALCTVAFFYAFSVLAFQLGMFFLWGNGNFSFLFIILLFVVNQLEFFDQIAEQMTKMMEQYPVMMWGVAMLVTVCIWFVCWWWSIKSYRKYCRD